MCFMQYGTMMCKQVSLSVKQFVNLVYIYSTLVLQSLGCLILQACNIISWQNMHLNGKAGINYISRVTFIGIRHVNLRVFTNTSMIAQPQQSTTICRSHCQSKSYPISKWSAQCSSLYTIYKSTF